MTKTVVTVKPHNTVRQARELLSKHRINQLPVVVNNKLVGIVSNRDICDAYPSSLRLLRGKDLADFADAHIIEEVMTYNVITVSSQTSLREAAQRLHRQRLGALPIVDQDKLVGIITRSDVLDALLMVVANGSPKTDLASSKETSWFTRFSAAFVGSQSNLMSEV